MEEYTLKSGTGMILDLSEMILPMALLKFTEASRKMKNGETMEVITEDQETRDNLFKVLQALYFELIGVHETETRIRIQLKKI